MRRAGFGWALAHRPLWPKTPSQLPALAGPTEPEGHEPGGRRLGEEDASGIESCDKQDRGVKEKNRGSGCLGSFLA